jgi:GTP1/Obg family GTP-binding protein
MATENEVKLAHCEQVVVFLIDHRVKPGMTVEEGITP